MPKIHKREHSRATFYLSEFVLDKLRQRRAYTNQSSSEFIDGLIRTEMKIAETPRDLMKICVVGTGYVGIVTGATLAEAGHSVTCLDIIEEKIADIKKGISPIYEPGLEQLIKNGLNNGNLDASTELEENIANSEIVFICVGTPSNEDGSIDLRYIENVSKIIGKAIKGIEKEIVIVVKSTVVPLTTEKIVQRIIFEESGRGRETIGIAMNPEFLREGSAIKDALNPDRIVLGCADEISKDALMKIYEGHTCPIMHCDPRTAEMIKYSSNSFLATKISFVNELANMCNKWNMDFERVAEGMGMDSRISDQFLRAGVGFGGSCFPKDVKALRRAAKNEGLNSEMLDATLSVNENQPEIVVNMAREKIGGLKNKKIAILGLAFKADTDDIRESRAFSIVEKLKVENAQVIGHDPQAAETFSAESGIECTKILEDALRNADCAIIQTEWSEYKTLEPEFLCKIMKTPVIIDGRRTFDNGYFANTEVEYLAIGLGN